MATFDGIDVEIKGIARFTPRTVTQYSSTSGDQVIVVEHGKSPTYRIRIATVGAPGLAYSLLERGGKKIQISFSDSATIWVWVVSIQILSRSRTKNPPNSYYVEAEVEILPESN